MIANYYIINYIRKLTILTFFNLICLCYFTNIYAGDIPAPLDDKELDTVLDNQNYSDSKIRLDDPEIKDDMKIEDFPPIKLAKYLPKDDIDKNIFYSLDRILHKDGFDLKNGKWWLLKALLYAPTPFFCGANTLIIAKTSAVTAKLVIAAQFTVPRTIESICSLTDQARLAIFEKRLKMWWDEKIAKDYKYGIPRLAWTITRLAVGIYLAYAYALIDAQTAGDAYRWIYSDVTSNKKALDAHDAVGYAFNFAYTAMLGAIFFFQLIDEFVTKGGFISRTIYNSCRGKQTENQDLEYEMLQDTISDLRTQTKLVCKYENSDEQIDSAIEEYLSDRGLNSMNTIASLQKYLGPENKPSSLCANIGSNIFKLAFIGGATVLCGVSFKYIFASGTILRNYVSSVGNKLTNGSYVFKLKNNGTFICDSDYDCTEGVDFNTILITDSQKDKLLELNKTADLANILQGIAISADTAVLILSAISLFNSLRNSYLHRRAFKVALLKDNCLRTSKIIPFIGAALILPAMVCYLENVNNVRPVAKTANKLLEATGQDSFIPVDLGIAATIGVLGATFALGAKLLSNLPHAIYAAPRKVMDIPTSTKKLCSDVSRWCK